MPDRLCRDVEQYKLDLTINHTGDDNNDNILFVENINFTVF